MKIKSTSRIDEMFCGFYVDGITQPQFWANFIDSQLTLDPYKKILNQKTMNELLLPWNGVLFFKSSALKTGAEIGTLFKKGNYVYLAFTSEEDMTAFVLRWA